MSQSQCIHSFNDEAAGRNVFGDVGVNEVHGLKEEKKRGLAGCILTSLQVSSSINSLLVRSEPIASRFCLLR